MQLVPAISGLLLYGLCQWPRDAAPCSASTAQKDGHTRSFQRLEDIIEAAIDNKEDDMVTLQFPPKATTPPPPPAGSVVRPRLGQNVSFSCRVPVGGNFTGISWTIQGRTVFEKGHPVAVPGLTEFQHHVFVRWYDSVVLRILNVSLLSSGEIACHLQAAARTTVLVRYTLIPRVTLADEIFATSLIPQEVSQRANVSISCRVRLPLAPEVVENIREHCLWHHNTELFNGVHDRPPWWARIAYDPDPIHNVPGSSFAFHLNIPIVQLKDTGPVECWFRPHRHLQEWIVQSSYLDVER